MRVESLITLQDEDAVLFCEIGIKVSSTFNPYPIVYHARAVTVYAGFSSCGLKYLMFLSSNKMKKKELFNYW